jgi:hypothetical protein
VCDGELRSEDSSLEIWMVGMLVKWTSALSDRSEGVDNGEFASETKGEFDRKERCTGASSMLFVVVGSWIAREISSCRLRTTLDRRRDAIGGLDGSDWFLAVGSSCNG